MTELCCMHEKKRSKPVTRDTSKGKIRNIGFTTLWSVDTWPHRHQDYVKQHRLVAWVKEVAGLNLNLSIKNFKEIMENVYWAFSPTEKLIVMKLNKC